jgi:hypothetical protein
MLYWSIALSKLTVASSFRTNIMWTCKTLPCLNGRWYAFCGRIGCEVAVESEELVCIRGGGV